MTTIYNATDGPLLVDRAGRVLGGRERREVDNLDGLSAHIEAGRIVVIETKASDDDTAGESDAPSPAPESASPRKASRRSSTTTTEEA